MRISLISPKWDRITHVYPPLGLAYVASVLEQAGHSVRIHIFSLDPTSCSEQDLDQVMAEVEVFRPELVGITATTNSYFGVLRTTDLVKERIGCPVVIGGPHATAFPEGTAGEPNVDFVVFGEGEATAVELVEALEKGQEVDGIKGLCFKKGERVVRNAPRPLILNLDSIPFPDRHLLELDRFPLRVQNGEPMTTVMTSRGCPFDCSYCFKGLFGRTYRQRSPENVLLEIRELVEVQGIRNFYFIDEYFLSSVKWMTEFCNGLIGGGLDVRWQCPARAETVTPDLLDLMYRAGCREIHYGVESGNQEILRQASSPISLDEIRTATAWTKQSRMLTKGYFMLGLPGDTERTMRQTIRLALELDFDEAEFSLTTPFPGTRLWQELAVKDPALTFDRHLAKAYFSYANSGSLAPFLNVSEVSPARLTLLASLAELAFTEHHRKKRYVSFFGKNLGRGLWYVSRVRGTRRLGSYLQRLGLFRGFQGGNREMAKVWS